MKIYAVVTIEDKIRYRKDGSNYIVNDMRIPGIYTTLEKAKECVENNYGDIWETSYNFVVIEETETDYLYPHTETTGYWWYKWKGLTGDAGIGTKGYVPCECPEQFKNTFGFGIG